MPPGPSDLVQDVAVPPVQPPPWLADDAFPPKPLDADYGYQSGRTLRPCTHEQLRAKVADGGMSAPSLVWTPETPRLVPPIEVPSLVDRVRLGRKDDAQQAIQRSLVSAVAWLFLSMFHGSWGLLLALMLGILPLIQALYARRQAKRLTPELALQQIPAARFEAWISLHRAWVTNVILVGLVLVGIAQLFIGLSATVSAAGLVKPLVQAGQCWRLLTATMLHGGVMHILFNAGALAALGHQVERLTNRPLLIIVYTLSALGGSISSCLLLPNATSVGASGAIMGLLGALTCLAIRSRSILPRGYLRSLLMNIGAIAIVGAVGYALIDNAAHLGGLLVGFLCPLFLIPRPATIPIPSTRLHRYLATACATILASAFLLSAFLILRA